MGEEEESDEKPDLSGLQLPRLIELLSDADERGPALRKTAVFMGKWLLAGTGISVVVAVGEIMQIGLGEAFARFGKWWLLTPIGITLIPAVFATFGLAVEVVVLVLTALISLPALLIGDRWFRIVRWGGLLFFAALGVWSVWAIGQGLAGGANPQVTSGTLALSPTPAATASPAWYTGPLAWLRGQSFGAVGGTVLTLLFQEWVRAKRLFEKKEKTKVLSTLLGPDGRPFEVDE